MRYLKHATAVTIKFGPFVDSTDGSTAETGLTIQKADVRLSKNGGNMAAANSDQGEADAGAPHDELGFYDVSLDAADTGTLGHLRVMVAESGALPVWDDFSVLVPQVWNSFYSTDILDVNVKEISDDSDAANNLETAADGGSYNLGGGGVVSASVTGAVGSVTGLTVSNIDAKISTRSSHSAADVVTALYATAVEGSTTFVQWIRRMGAVLFGKASGGGSAGSKKFRDTGDTVDRITAVTDENGNRNSVTFDDA